MTVTKIETISASMAMPKAPKAGIGGNTPTRAPPSAMMTSIVPIPPNTIPVPHQRVPRGLLTSLASLMTTLPVIFRFWVNFTGNDYSSARISAISNQEMLR
jgi:hypothetical protein